MSASMRACPVIIAEGAAQVGGVNTIGRLRHKQKSSREALSYCQPGVAIAAPIRRVMLSVKANIATGLGLDSTNDHGGS